ncbi:MAG: DUF4197 domain-containing protein [Owenweeksia sp.]
MRSFSILAICIILVSCDQLQQIAEEAGKSTLPPTKTEISDGIREALQVGIKNAVFQTAQKNGFYNNSLIKIPFPPEAAKVEKTVRDLGLGKQVDQFVETLNHGAEEAAQRATPVFISAIKQMTIQDVYDIWRGDNDAATRYLQLTTQDKLIAEFRPVIKQALDEVDITRYWNPLITTYNQLPLTNDLNPNLDEYVLDRAMNGLFLVLAQEEEKIREDPAARVTDLLKKVFGYQGPDPAGIN